MTEQQPSVTLAAGTSQADAKAPPRHRAVRKPFGSMDQKLAWEPIEGFHLHWFNDVPGRIERAKAAGYEHVKDADGKPAHRVVGTANSGGALEAYLMKIPEQFYDEDMKLEQDRIDKDEDDRKRGQIEGKSLSASDKPSHFYRGREHNIGQREVTIKR